MNTDREEHRREWEDNFSGLLNVRIVPQERHSLKAERRKVHYPLAHYIAEGGLSASRLPELKRFSKESVLILNNFRLPLCPDLKIKRPWFKDKRPDIIVVTKAGEVSIIQCKQRNELGKDMEEEFYAFTALLDFASKHSVVVDHRELINPWDKWEETYNERYVKDNRFPDFRSTLAQLFDINTDLKRNKWANSIMQYIGEGKARYGVAYDGDIDDYVLKRLNKIHYKFNQWSNGQNELYIFAVDNTKNLITVDKIGNILNRRLV